MKYKFEITIGPPKSGEVCDFCSDPHVYGAFPAKTFLHKEVNGVLLSSLSGWAACETCHWLIKVEAWGALTTRSVATSPTIALGFSVVATSRSSESR